MNHYLSIGEMAKLNDLSIQRLRYYDALDLFKPAYIDKKTGYRYYLKEQTRLLTQIQSLQYAGLELKKIAEILMNFNPEQLVPHLEQLQVKINNKERRLMRQNMLLCAYQESLTLAKPPKNWQNCSLEAQNVFLIETKKIFSKHAWHEERLAFIEALKQNQLSKSYFPFISARITVNSGEMALFIRLCEPYDFSNQLPAGLYKRTVVTHADISATLSEIDQLFDAEFFIFRPLLDLDAHTAQKFVIEVYEK